MMKATDTCHACVTIAVHEADAIYDRTGEAINYRDLLGKCPHHKNAPLQSAIDALGAVEVAPGRYAAQVKAGKSEPCYPTARWVTFDARMLELAGIAASQGRLDLVGDFWGWAALYAGTLMPSWWTPERRYCVLDEVFATLREAEDCADTVAPRPSVITASLETGEEVPT